MNYMTTSFNKTKIEKNVTFKIIVKCEYSLFTTIKFKIIANNEIETTFLRNFEV